MIPEIDVHAPHGLLPAATVRRRTVLDVQPGVLLLLLAVAAAVLVRRRSRTVTPVAPASAGSGAVGAGTTAVGPTPQEAEQIRTAAAEAYVRPLP